MIFLIDVVADVPFALDKTTYSSYVLQPRPHLPTARTPIQTNLLQNRTTFSRKNLLYINKSRFNDAQRQRKTKTSETTYPVIVIMRPDVESDWEPGTSHPSDGSFPKYSTRKNRFQVQVQETEDERICNHNNQVCSFTEQRSKPLRGIPYHKTQQT